MNQVSHFTQNWAILINDSFVRDAVKHYYIAIVGEAPSPNQILCRWKINNKFRDFEISVGGVIKLACVTLLWNFSDLDVWCHRLTSRILTVPCLEWQGTFYQFTCLPNGLFCARRVFTKILKLVYSYLRGLGHICMRHIDDSLLISYDRKICGNNSVDSTN